MRPMVTIQDLIEEAKLRTVWWALWIFVVSYFLTHTSKSMWMNIPVAVLLVSDGNGHLERGLSQWKVQIVAALKGGTAELQSMTLKGGGALTLGKIYEMVKVHPVGGTGEKAKDPIFGLAMGAGSQASSDLFRYYRLKRAQTDAPEYIIDSCNGYYCDVFLC